MTEAQSGQLTHKLMLRDIDIRALLRAKEIRKQLLIEPASQVVDELGIFEGAYRVDLAVINDKLHGYEIKSAVDTLERLPAQQKNFSRIFDHLTLVVDEKHANHATRIIPNWWGLIVAGIKDGLPYTYELCPPRQNKNVEPYALCQLLWRDEALSILRARKLSKGLQAGSRKFMWRRLAEEIHVDELKLLIWQTLKKRSHWRAPVS